jgi:hypothetical protein
MAERVISCASQPRIGLVKDPNRKTILELGADLIGPIGAVVVDDQKLPRESGRHPELGYRFECPAKRLAPVPRADDNGGVH